MSLISFEFALFLLAVLWLNWALRSRRTAYRVFLLTVNAVFYASQSTGLLLLPLGVGVSNYLFALFISRTQKNCSQEGLAWRRHSPQPGFSRFFQVFRVSVSITGFSPRASGSESAPALLSNSTFQSGFHFLPFRASPTASTSIGTQRRLIRNPIDVLLFVSFFPHDPLGTDHARGPVCSPTR